MTPAQAAYTPDNSFILLRRRWLDVTVGSGLDPAVEPYRTRLAKLGTRAAEYWDSMMPSHTALWPDMPFPSFTGTPARLQMMARAFVLPGTGLTGDTDLARVVAEGIDH